MPQQPRNENTRFVVCAGLHALLLRYEREPELALVASVLQEGDHAISPIGTGPHAPSSSSVTRATGALDFARILNDVTASDRTGPVGSAQVVAEEVSVVRGTIAPGPPPDADHGAVQDHGRLWVEIDEEGSDTTTAYVECEQ